jgi:predicted RNA-binding protein with PIN domain
MPPTLLDKIENLLKSLVGDLQPMVEEYAGFKVVNKTGSTAALLSPTGDHYWEEMSPEGKKIQQDLIPRLQRLSELLSVLIEDLPDGAEKEINDTLDKISEAVRQEGKSFWQTPEEATEAIEEAADKIISTLNEYYDSAQEEVLIIPDTNALYDNPDIENWAFNDISTFTLVLTPSILSELDDHKTHHPTQSVREKAQKLINKMKEYRRRRSSPHETVKIVSEHIFYKTISVEPDMESSLSWLDPDVNDDRFLASALEIIKNDPGKSVFLVTADINLQEKIETAGLPYLEPPNKNGN